MSKKNSFRSSFFALLALVAAAGCGPQTRPEPEKPGLAILPAIPKERKLVAIVGFENKSTFAADKLWDTCSEMLYTELFKTKYFRLVEWNEMKRLFAWDDLAHCTIVKVPEKRKEARKILLCEYFLSGAVTQFDVRDESQVTRLRKYKRYTTTIRVDLRLQDAPTGESIVCVEGSSTKTKVLRGSFLGGQTGSWDPHSADEALVEAIQRALTKLVCCYHDVMGEQQD